jgi:hypothetical protein
MRDKVNTDNMRIGETYYVGGTACSPFTFMGHIPGGGFTAEYSSSVHTMRTSTKTQLNNNQRKTQ